MAIEAQAERPSELVMEVGKAILSSERYAGDDWDSLAIVGNFKDGRKNAYGYVYLGNDWEARLPGGFDVLKALKALRDEMATRDGRAWHRCLVQIKRDGLAFDIQFEYDDPDRWTVSPATVEQDALALKPA